MPKLARFSHLLSHSTLSSTEILRKNTDDGGQVKDNLAIHIYQLPDQREIHKSSNSSNPPPATPFTAELYYNQNRLIQEK